MLKEYYKNEKRNKKFKDLIKFIEHFSLFIKQCYRIVLSAEKVRKVKIQKLQGQKVRGIMILSKCLVCDSKKSKSIKHQDASELLISLGIKIPLSKIPLEGPLFLTVLNKLKQVKMNEIVT